MIKIATYQKTNKQLEATLEPYKGKKIIVRMGGDMDYPDYPIQVNSVEAIRNCVDKMKMKNIFIDNNIKTLPILKEDEVQAPVVIKGIIRSKGASVFVVDENNEIPVYRKVLKQKYYFEPLFNTTSEYRLHCTQDKVFFSVKKKKKEGMEADIIINEKNHVVLEKFLKPRLWAEIQAECLKAMKATGLELGACDVGYDSSNKKEHKFVIHEINTSPEILKPLRPYYKEAIESIIATKLK
jgi:glutathione synthase/RimK-type ligase-like ATP-grasp enzyme